MRDSLRIGLHAIFFLLFTFGVYYDYVYVVIPPSVARMPNAFGGKFKYLTFWDAIIQAVFFFICILNDCVGTNAVSPKKPPFIRRLKDIVYAIFCFPTSMFVASVFWSLYFIDRELVFPKSLDPYFPWWLNQLMHTLIVISTLLEMVMEPKKYPKRFNGVVSNQIFMICYLIWMLVIYFKSGVWVYGVFSALNWPLKITFVASLVFYTTILYIIGEIMDNFLWGNEYIKHQKSHAKNK